MIEQVENVRFQESHRYQGQFSFDQSMQHRWVHNLKKNRKLFNDALTHIGKLSGNVRSFRSCRLSFAKFCSSYDTLNGGITANGLPYLTGGATIKIDISPEQIQKIEEVFDENPEDAFDDFF